MAVKYPWCDYSGKFSGLKAIVFVALFIPGLWIAYALANHLLGARPLIEANHQTGLWAVRLLFVALAVTPLSRLWQWPRLNLVRRMIGVAAFSYIAAHLVLYAAEEMFNLGTVASEILARVYLAIGFTAWLGLAALAATSTDAMVKRLGPRRWQALHRFVYLIAFLGTVHYFIQSKLEVWEPMWIAGLLAWLIGYRAFFWIRGRNTRLPLWGVAALSVAASVLTGLGEAIYFTLAFPVPIERVLLANFSLDAGVRPSWVVLGVGALITLGAVLRRGARQKSRPAAAAPLSAVARKPVSN